MASIGCDLYVVKSDSIGAYKIGRSNDSERRVENIRKKYPVDAKLVHVIKGKGNEESRVHAAWIAYRLFGEWFMNSGEFKSWVENGCDLLAIPDETTIGSHVRQSRGDITQEELAAKAGITQQYLSDIERDVKVPSLAVLKAIGSVLGKPVSSLLDGVSKVRT